MRRAALLLALVAVACGEAPDELECPRGRVYAVRVHPERAAYLDSLAWAAGEWSAATGGAFVADVAIDARAEDATREACVVNVTPMTSSSRWGEANALPNPSGAGVASATVLLSEAPPGEETRRAIVLHELGHAIGLPDVDDPGSAMWVKIHVPARLSDADREAARRRWW